MGLVFEHQKPLLVLAVVINGDFYGAGVDFLAFVKVGEQTVFFQLFCRKGSYIHKANGLISSSQFFAVYFVFLICIGDVGSIDLRAVNNSAESGVTAVVAPVGVYHSYFGNGGAFVFAFKIILTEFYIIVVHSQTVFFHKVGKPVFVKLKETAESNNFRGNIIFYLKGVVFFKTALSGFHRVDKVMLYSREFLVADISAQYVNFCVFYNGAFALTQHLYTLGGTVRTLVKLSREKLHGENTLFTPEIGQFVKGVVNGRFAENGRYGASEVFF